MTIPEGFKEIPTESPFVQMVGPLYYKEEQGSTRVGVLIERKHCNSSGSIHGGMIATIMDLVLGNKVGTEAVPQAVIEKFKADGVSPDPDDLPKLVTAQLSINYIGRASVGDWIEIRATADQAGKGLSFATGEIMHGDEKVSSATGVYRNLNAKK